MHEVFFLESCTSPRGVLFVDVCFLASVAPHQTVLIYMLICFSHGFREESKADSKLLKQYLTNSALLFLSAYIRCCKHSRFERNFSSLTEGELGEPLFSNCN